jgi:hypothetical protein
MALGDLLVSRVGRLTAVLASLPSGRPVQLTAVVGTPANLDAAIGCDPPFLVTLHVETLDYDAAVAVMAVARRRPPENVGVRCRS